jgi:hypothetical protein
MAGLKRPRYAVMDESEEEDGKGESPPPPPARMVAPYRTRPPDVYDPSEYDDVPMAMTEADNEFINDADIIASMGANWPSYVANEEDVAPAGVTEEEEEIASVEEQLYSMRIGDRNHGTCVSLELIPGGWTDMLDAVCDHYQQQEDRLDYARRVIPREEGLRAGLRENQPANGSRIDSAIMRSVNSMGWKLSETQNRFMQLARLACLPLIYGAEYGKHEVELLARANIQKIMRWLLVTTPRRCGKTTMVAMFIAALMCHKPGIRIAVFSTVHRTATKQMNEIEKYLEYADPNIKSRIIKHSKEILSIAPRGYQGSGKGSRGVDIPADQISIVYSYPASVKGVRGFTVDLIIIDEAAHTPEPVWKLGIVPALGTENMVLLAITTCDGPTNFFSKLLSCRNEKTGDALFNSITVQLACDACQKKGVMEMCVHNKHLLPTWKSDSAQEDIKQLLGGADTAAYQQEIMGINSDVRELAFPEMHLHRFEQLPPVRFSVAPSRLYTFVDPSGGGKSSDLAIITALFEESSLVVSVLSFHSRPR